MMIIAITTAATITQSLSAMPTAVMTESSEKMMSMMAIWITTPRKVTPAAPCGLSGSSSSFSTISWISTVAL